MKLTYRGIQHSQGKSCFSGSTLETNNKKIVYRGNSLKGRISPKFPWLNYIKQLFFRSQSKPIFDPITFWYDRKRKFIEDCWRFGDIEKLNTAWNLTIQIERDRALRSKPKIQLKYRGVIYYK